MRKVLLVICIILSSNYIFAASILPEEYYSYKKMLNVSYSENGPQSIYVGIKNSRQEDLEIIGKMVQIIKQCPPDGKEVTVERDFIVSAIMYLLPITEYNNGNEAFFDNYAKLSDSKKDYYVMIVTWSRENHRLALINEGETPENADKIVDASWTMNNPKTYNEGKQKYLSLFNEGNLDARIVYSYFNLLSASERDAEVHAFYNTYFGKMSASQLDNYQLGPVAEYIISAEKKYGNHIEFANRLMDVLNPAGANKLNLDKHSDSSKDFILDVLCQKDLVSNSKFSKRLKNYIKNNRKFLIRKDKFFSFKNETKDYILNSRTDLELDNDVKIKLERLKR